MINEFNQKVKALDLNHLSDEELVSEVEKLKKDVLARNNLYVRDVLQRASLPV